MVNFKQLDKPYFIGEIGINHNGDIDIAKKLIDAVNACNWDCAKFQKEIQMSVCQNIKKVKCVLPRGEK